MSVTDLFEKLPVGKRYDQHTVLASGIVPVIDQGKSGVIGYHNDKPGVIATADSPIVTFANHTCQVTLQKRPFSVIQNVFPLKARTGVDPWFLYYRIKNAMTFQDYKGHWPDFVTLQYFVPSYNEQKRIAGVLAAFDEKIENNNRIIKTLEEMAQAIFKEWFIKNAKGKNQKVNLGDIADIVMGQSPKSEHYNENREGLPFHQGVTKFGARFPTHEIFSVAGEKKAGDGDILVSVRAPVGRLNIANTEMILGRGLSAVRHKQNKQSFLFYTLKNVFVREDLFGSGSVFPAITKKEFEELPVNIGNEETVNEFEETVSPFDQQIRVLIEENQKLAAMRDLLLPRLMSGEIRV